MAGLKQLFKTMKTSDFGIFARNSTEFAALSICSHMINRYITRYNGRNNLSKVFDETCFNEVGIGRTGTSSRSFFPRNGSVDKVSFNKVYLGLLEPCHSMSK